MSYHTKPFSKFANTAAHATGQPWSFVAAALLVVAWLVSGPLFGFSDTWQLVINTSTTIITFLMVFVIQNSQNRENYALQIKLDELIRTSQGAQNALLDLEEMEEEELRRIRDGYERLAREARAALGERDLGAPEAGDEGPNAFA